MGSTAGVSTGSVDDSYNSIVERDINIVAPVAASTVTGMPTAIPSLTFTITSLAVFRIPIVVLSSS